MNAVDKALKAMPLATLAKRAGIGVSHASLVFRGRRNPSAKVLHSLSSALGVDSADLLAYAGRARLTELTPQQRSELARKAARVRWGSKAFGWVRALSGQPPRPLPDRARVPSDRGGSGY